MAWNADAHMVRDRGAPGYNLAVGDPVFLREAYREFYPLAGTAGGVAVDLGYPDTKPEKLLGEELAHRHPGQQVVVAVGAKQALSAAISALSATTGRRLVTAPAPHWPSFRTLAEKQGLEFSSGGAPEAISIVTAPNNPDGSQSRMSCDIHDACYCAPVYGWRDRMPPAAIRVWSAGKQLGCVGARVGWATTEDLELAKLMTQYVEQTTSGVSTIDQTFVALTLRNTRLFPTDFDAATTRGRQLLDANGREFERLAPFLDRMEGCVWGGAGMFVYLEARDAEKFAAALRISGVRGVPGSACGDDRRGWWRFAAGGDFKVVYDAVAALRTALETL